MTIGQRARRSGGEHVARVHVEIRGRSSSNLSVIRRSGKHRHMRAHLRPMSTEQASKISRHPRWVKRCATDVCRYNAPARRLHNDSASTRCCATRRQLKCLHYPSRSSNQHGTGSPNVARCRPPRPSRAKPGLIKSMLGHARTLKGL